MASPRKEKQKSNQIKKPLNFKGFFIAIHMNGGNYLFIPKNVLNH
jgi:hypothetical protein